MTGVAANPYLLAGALTRTEEPMVPPDAFDADGIPATARWGDQIKPPDGEVDRLVSRRPSRSGSIPSAQTNHTIAVFGLGYVGAVSAACFAKRGHCVIGVDPQQSKVDLINQGMPPIVEEGLAEIIRDMAGGGRLRATSNAMEAMAESSISFICVGTPSRANGSLDLTSLTNVCEQIGATLREKEGFHVVIVRSTILPGTMRDLVLPTLERASGKKAGLDFGLAHNPEFLREGSAVTDFDNPAKTVIGAFDEESTEIVARFYSHFDAPLICTRVETAEMIKYVDNSWHALKVAFANEIGNICKAVRIDSHAVMDIFCCDTKLNLSPYYLKPGFAFGGSCLPKDLRALTYAAHRADLSVPVLESVLQSNRVQIERAVRLVTARRLHRIGVLGFSFKAGTDDLRESPMVDLIETLIGKGYDLKVYDRNVQLGQLMGANRDFLLRAIPHIFKLMATTIDEVLAHAELILIGTGELGYRDICTHLAPHQVLIDMVRLPGIDVFSGQYDGINW
jgi:GDP-mannose 6-dehydrogenase